MPSFLHVIRNTFYIFTKKKLPNLIDILVTATLSLIMYGVGVSIEASQVVAILRKPKPLLVALFSQMIFLPLTAFAICFTFSLPATIKIGLIILSSAPGGGTAGFLTYLFRGNTALSVTLTSINSLLTLFSIPIVVNLGLYFFWYETEKFSLPFQHTFIEILFVTILPVGLGILTRRYLPALSLKISRYARPVLLVMLGIVFLIKIQGNSSGESGLTLAELRAILPFALLQNICCLAIGFFLPRVFKIPLEDRLTTAIESGVQNTTLAFLIAGLLNNADFAKPALVYAMFSFWTCCIFCLSVHFYNKRTLRHLWKF